MKQLAAYAALMAALCTTSAQAHHSFAVFFDPESPVTITGTVTAFRFTNPHGTIALDVPRSDGSIEHWRVETNAPVVLQRRGWRRDSVRPGETVTIDGWRARDGKPYARLRAARDAEGNMIGNSPFGQGDD